MIQKLVSLIVFIFLGAQLAYTHDVILHDGNKLIGIITKVTESEIFLETDYAGVLTIDRAKVKSYTPEAFKERAAEMPPGKTPVKWTGKIEAGGAFTSGNSDTKSLTGKTMIKRETDKTRLNLNGITMYGKEEDVETVNYSKGSGKFDYFLNERLYLYALGTAMQDRIANINLRANGGGGLGYYLIKMDNLTLQVEGDAEAEYTKKQDEKTVTDPVLRFAGILHYKINDTVRLEATGQYYPNLKNNDLYHADSTASIIFKLYERLNAKVTVQINYENSPADDKKKTDVMGFGSLEYELF
ncbi:MAG: DUF481 domain-containing protein [Candidatus Aureabacteria bacterium]|nr:DUF481 domain-containing protein [Candidatus Auribacterota bacterium]